MQILLNNELTIRHHLPLSAKKLNQLQLSVCLVPQLTHFAKPVRYAKNNPITQIVKRVILNFKIFNDIKCN